MKIFLFVLYFAGLALNINAQNVGIGTATPTNKLEVSGVNGLKVSNNTDWIAGNFGGVQNSGDRVVIGRLGANATIGANNSNLTVWSTLLINPSGDTKIDATNGVATSFGAVKISTLAGQGNRMVVADNNGLLSTQPIITSLNNVSSNGLTTDGANNTKLGSNLNHNTFINGNGNSINFFNNTPVEIADQAFEPSFLNSFCLKPTIWQSFTPEFSGQLTKISFRFYLNEANMTFRIYEGEGTGGAVLLSSPNVTTPANSPPTIYDFATPGVNVIANHKYTFAFQAQTSTNVLVGCSYAGYPRGTNDASISNPSTEDDYFFRTYVLQSPSSNLSINDGLLGINTANPAYNLHVNGPVAATAAFLNLSDQRFKTNIQPLENSLEKIRKLRGISFDWDLDKTGEKNVDTKNHLGFIAQEIEQVLPQVVSTANDSDKTKSVAYGDVVPVLVQALQERQKLIDNMQQQIDELKALAAKMKKKRVRRR